jgi:beta-lactamase regulating signal transducer with metallopeptidase domain
MMSEQGILTAAAWMITYLLHSTALLAAVWALARTLRARQEAVLEMLWRFALIAPVLTASLQIGLSIRPLAGVLPAPARIASEGAVAPRLPHRVSAAPISEPDPTDDAPLAARQLDDRPVHSHSEAGTSAYRPAVTNIAGIPGRASTLSDAGARGRERVRSFRAALGALDASACLLGVTAILGVALIITAARSILGRVRLWALMRERRPITDGQAAMILRRLQQRSSVSRRVRLTSSRRLAVPIAFGVFRPEICLPACVLEQFSPSEQESVLAHELAHHVRRDPAWQALTRLIEGLLFFQPLNGLACRRLRELSELACDAWAAEQTGDRVTLAHCLAEVAAWIVQRGGDPMLPRAIGMAGSPSALRRRIVRLLDDAPRLLARGARGSFCALAPLILAFTIWTVPGVGAPPRRAASAEAHDSPTMDDRTREDGDGAALWADAHALLDDLSRLETCVADLGKTADRLPLDDLRVDSIRELTDRAQLLRDRGERLMNALMAASEGAAQRETEETDDDQLDY